MTNYFSSIILIILSFISMSIYSQEIDDNIPLLMIGASYFNGSTRIDDNGNAALNGVAVNFGSYFDLESGLIKNKKLNGLIINEAHVGSTTFDRYSCGKTICLNNGKILGYKQQFERAIKRVSIIGIKKLNARYLLIGLPNNCIHSDAFGIAQSYTKKCTIEDIKRTSDSIVEIVENATMLGLVAIVAIPPKFEGLNLELTKEILNLEWVVSKKEYDFYAENYVHLIKNNTTNAIFLDIWSGFVHQGDGIHPDKTSVTNAADKIADFITNSI